MKTPFKSYSEAVSDAVKVGEEVINNFWNILEHPDFPFLTLNSTTNGHRNFPVYNIIENKAGKVRLEMALAGYTRDRLKVEVVGTALIIQGLPVTSALGTEGDEIRHRGIANAVFTRAFELRADAFIESVQFKDGLLTVEFGTKEKTRIGFEIK